jgi:hypothetical protein
MVRTVQHDITTRSAKRGNVPLPLEALKSSADGSHTHCRTLAHSAISDRSAAPSEYCRHPRPAATSGRPAPTLPDGPFSFARARAAAPSTSRRPTDEADLGDFGQKYAGGRAGTRQGPRPRFATRSGTSPADARPRERSVFCGHPSERGRFTACQASPLSPCRVKGRGPQSRKRKPSASAAKILTKVNAPSA